VTIYWLPIGNGQEYDGVGVRRHNEDRKRMRISPLEVHMSPASEVRDLRVSKIVRSLARRIDVFRILDRCRYSTISTTCRQNI
jgi:hypothetical protein